MRKPSPYIIAPPRAQQGFTMMEVIGVVAILAVVMALTVPNVVQLQRNMRMTELDAKAEQVYNAAQYRLTEMKAAGTLGKLALDAAEETAHAVVPGDYGLVQAAADRDGYTLQAGKDSIRYAAKGEEVATILLSEASVTQGVTDGNFAIEYSRLSGEVYSVFYWDPGYSVDADSASASATDAASVGRYYRAVRDHRSDRAYRTDHYLGYWNGGQVSDEYEKEESSDSSSSPSSSAPSSSAASPDSFDLADSSLSIENREELYVKIANSSFAADDFDPAKLKLEVTIVQKLLSGEARATMTADGTDMGFEAGQDEIDFILDSMFKDADGTVMSLENLLKANGAHVVGDNDWIPGFVMGANFDITAKVSYDGVEIPSVSTTVNSAYDHYDGDKNWGVVEVASLRQLMNIGTARFDYNYSSYNEIRITSDIDFDGTTWDDENVAMVHRDRDNLNPLYDEASGEYESVEPIELPGNFNNSTARIIEGEGHAIRNLHIRSTTDNSSDTSDNTGTGMFETLGVRLTNVTFENAHVEGVKNVGVLAGSMKTDKVVISNCYVLGGEVKGTENVGGMVGYANGPHFQNCAASIDVNAPGAVNVGGFVGEAGSSTMVADCQVMPSYGADGTPVFNTVAGKTNVGGFAGTLMLGDAGERCEARVNVTGVDNVGGFAGFAKKQMKESVASGVFDLQGNKAYPVTVTGSGSNVGGFYGVAAMNTNSEDCLAMVNVVGSGDNSCNVGGFVGDDSGKDQWGNSNSGPFLRCAARGEPAITADDNGDGVPDGRLSVTATGSNVGGFAGRMPGGSAQACFAAIDVRAADAASSQAFNYGGFIGLQNGAPTIKKCYSSGTVSANSAVGGFYGRVSGSNEIENCYTTSDVTAYSTAGGFVGTVQGGSEWSWSQGTLSYGRVSGHSGTGGTFGGFYGTASVNMKNKTFKFLQEEGYNQGLGNSEGASSYEVLAVGTGVAEQSHPFASALRGKAFPFPLVVHDGTALDHYGDWARF